MTRRACAGVFVLIALAAAQRPFSGTPEIRHALERLADTRSVLMIAAHPDDENASLLAYLARGRNLRTAYLSLTRGEGGQNLLGPEQGGLLGVIRTQELLQARRVDGAEQLFTTAVDFGYSKSADEALRVWGHEKTLGEIVWHVRSFRPDVIVLQFSGTARDGHGQHQASAILGREAFTAAADRNRFPEQLKHVEPWRARRLLWNAYWDPEQPHFTIDVGRFDPVLGYSYAEIGGITRSLHRSQAFGASQPKGPSLTRIVNVAGEPAREDVLDGIDTSWKSVDGGAPVAQALARAMSSFNPVRPESSIPDLLEARRHIERVTDRAFRIRKLRELDHAIALAAGLWLDAAADRDHASPASSAGIGFTALNRSSAGVELVSIELGNTKLTGELLPRNQPVIRKLTWQAERGGTPPAVFTVRIGAAELRFEQPVIYRWVDPQLGERTRDFTVVPPVSVAITQPAVIFPDPNSRRVAVQVRALTPEARGIVRLDADREWRISPGSHQFNIRERGLQQTVYFDVLPPAAAVSRAVSAIATVGGTDVGTTTTTIDYPHIEPQTVIEPAVSRFVRADVKVLSRNIGYVTGAGDEVPQALEQIGCRITLLTADELAHGDLSRFDAIMTGVRAWNVRDDLRANRGRLFDYAAGGGTLVVQYNVTRPPPGEFAPFPIELSQDRVSVEDAPVRIVDPESPLLRVPNRITESDFAGWVQERGLYFASKWDPRYRPVIASADPGEKLHAGGLLWAPHGKGVYIFTAYSWFRQLPAGVPGAYRIVANLISAGKALSGKQ